MPCELVCLLDFSASLTPIPYTGAKVLGTKNEHNISDTYVTLPLTGRTVLYMKSVQNQLFRHKPTLPNS
jgi:hypothetical protein